MRSVDAAENESSYGTPIPGTYKWASEPGLMLLAPWDGKYGRASVTERCQLVVTPLDERSTADYEYTRWHRETWSLLVRHTDAECLSPPDVDSWIRLWGRLGLEFFRLFINGDDCIRSDMMRRAISTGSWRGDVVARRLSSWAEGLRGVGRARAAYGQTHSPERLSFALSSAR